MKGERRAPDESARGYALAAAGAALFSLNGSVGRYLLDDGVDAAWRRQAEGRAGVRLVLTP